jgi:VIT1/CCC1 family predicted Fe2+/Mn2+ transporter
LDYSSWLQKVFPQLNETSKETIDSYVEKAKSDTELFRIFFKVLGGIFFIVPFNLYLYASGIQSYVSILYWILVFSSFGVVGFIGLYCEQKLIKKHLKKIIRIKYT